MVTRWTYFFAGAALGLAFAVVVRARVDHPAPVTAAPPAIGPAAAVAREPSMIASPAAPTMIAPPPPVPRARAKRAHRPAAAQPRLAAIFDAALAR